MKTLTELWKYRNNKKIPIGNRNPRIDQSMVNLIEMINKTTHHKTLGCCCGHGKYPMTIVVKDVVGVYELISGKSIPRKTRFYLKDKEGFYYIPETL